MKQRLGDEEGTTFRLAGRRGTRVVLTLIKVVVRRQTAAGTMIFQA